MKHLRTALAAAALCTGILQAQAPPAGQTQRQGPPPQGGAMAAPMPPKAGTIADVIQEQRAPYDQIKQIIIASVDAMPADKFSYKPTPEIRSYAELFTHVAQSQNGICNGILGTGRATPITATAKDDVKAAVVASFANCDAAFAKITADNAMEISGQGFGRASGPGKISRIVTHDNEMYGQMVVYLRINGIVPPSTAMRGRM